MGKLPRITILTEGISGGRNWLNGRPAHGLGHFRVAWIQAQPANRLPEPTRL